MTLDKYFEDFLVDLELEKGRSMKTIANYKHYLQRFFSSSNINSPSDITDNKVRSFRLYLNRLGTNGLNARTRNYHLIALRMFLKYLAKRNVESLAPEKIDLARVPERDIDIPIHEDLERLLKAPSGNDIKSLRDKAILELLFSTGLRVGELVALDKDTVNLRQDEFSVRGKGGKLRVVFLSKTAKDALEKYLAKRGDIDEALLVGTQKNRPRRLTSRQVERLVQGYAIKAGITKKVTPHTLRHLFATDLLTNGADIRSVQALLGHSSITTTQIYTHVTDRQLREIHKTFHGKKRK